MRKSRVTFERKFANVFHFFDKRHEKATRELKAEIEAVSEEIKAVSEDIKDLRE